MEQTKIVLETMAAMEVELTPFESWLLTGKRGESSYTRQIPKYEPPKGEDKPKPVCILNDDFMGFSRL